MSKDGSFSGKVLFEAGASKSKPATRDTEKNSQQEYYEHYGDGGEDHNISRTFPPCSKAVGILDGLTME